MAAGALVSVAYSRSFACQKSGTTGCMRERGAEWWQFTGRNYRTRSHVPSGQHQSESTVPFTRLSPGFSSYYTLTDPYASVRDFASGGVHRSRERVHADILDRGNARTVERRVVGHHGRGASTCRAFWYLRDGEGVCRRERRGRAEPVDSNVCVVSDLSLLLAEHLTVSVLSPWPFVPSPKTRNHVHPIILPPTTSTSAAKRDINTIPNARHTALAGASATIASDALMNPFDGEMPAPSRVTAHPTVFLPFPRMPILM